MRDDRFAVGGYCPSCGGASLFLGVGGLVVCSRVDCPEPDAVSTLLQDRELQHIVVLETTGFTIRHPLRERLNDRLMVCGLDHCLSNLDGPPRLPGRYRATDLGVAGGYSWELLEGSDA